MATDEKRLANRFRLKYTTPNNITTMTTTTTATTAPIIDAVEGPLSSVSMADEGNHYMAKLVENVLTFGCSRCMYSGCRSRIQF
jgi:hypothetical protein